MVILSCLAKKNQNLNARKKKFSLLVKVAFSSQKRPQPHVIQQPKETCQTTCRGPMYSVVLKKKPFRYEICFKIHHSVLVRERKESGGGKSFGQKVDTA